MGLLIDFKQPVKVSEVQVVLNQIGASVELRSGTTDPTAGLSGPGARASDTNLIKNFTLVGQAQNDFDGTRMIFNLDDTTTQYLLVLITKLPPKGDKFAVTINEITVLGGGA